LGEAVFGLLRKRPKRVKGVVGLDARCWISRRGQLSADSRAMLFRSRMLNYDASAAISNSGALNAGMYCAISKHGLVDIRTITLVKRFGHIAANARADVVPMGKRKLLKLLYSAGMFDDET